MWHSRLGSLPWALLDPPQCCVPGLICCGGLLQGSLPEGSAAPCVVINGKALTFNFALDALEVIAQLAQDFLPPLPNDKVSSSSQAPGSCAAGKTISTQDSGLPYRAAQFRVQPSMDACGPQVLRLLDVVLSYCCCQLLCQVLPVGADGLGLRSGCDEMSELRRDALERDEKRLAELGRRTVEMYALAHIFTERLEVRLRRGAGGVRCGGQLCVCSGVRSCPSSARTIRSRELWQGASGAY